MGHRGATRSAMDSFVRRTKLLKSKDAEALVGSRSGVKFGVIASNSDSR